MLDRQKVLDLVQKLRSYMAVNCRRCGGTEYIETVDPRTLIDKLEAENGATASQFVKVLPNAKLPVWEVHIWKEADGGIHASLDGIEYERMTELEVRVALGETPSIKIKQRLG